MADPDRRSWAGTTLAARRAQRREQLEAAGFALLGEQGAEAVTVRGACRRAGLSERYFYESFAGREQLLLAVHERVAREAQEAIAAAVATAPGPDHPPERLAAHVLDAFTDYLEADPRRGRILLLEAFADETLARHGLELVPRFAALLVDQMAAAAHLHGPDEQDATLSSVAMVGALAHLYLAWLDGSLEVDRERLVDHAARLLVRAAGVRSHTVAARTR